jgi:hypothetical protein
MTGVHQTTFIFLRRKGYQSVEDLSTHMVLRHPSEPVPLPEGSVNTRKVCTEVRGLLAAMCVLRRKRLTQCGKWYELDRDLEVSALCDTCFISLNCAFCVVLVID